MTSGGAANRPAERAAACPVSPALPKRESHMLRIVGVVVLIVIALALLMFFGLLDAIF